MVSKGRQGRFDDLRLPGHEFSDFLVPGSFHVSRHYISRFNPFACYRREQRCAGSIHRASRSKTRAWYI